MQQKIRAFVLALLPMLAGAQTPGLLQGSHPLRLSLKQAVEIALAPEGNTRIQLAQEFTRQAEARSAEARAALLPNFDSYVTEEDQTRNLATFGLNLNIPIPGFVFPTLVGPFGVFDARVTASQTVFDFSSIRRFQAARVGVRAAEADSDSAHDQISAQVATLYLNALAAQAHVEAAEANVELAQANAKLSEDRKNAGTGIAIDVTRAQVQLADEKQRLLIAENERRQANLQLLRAIGLKLESGIELTGKLAYEPAEEVTAGDAIKRALESRSDYKAQQRREQNARLSYSATKFERLPSLAGFADYGATGTAVSNSLATRTYGVTLRLPLFDGGRRDARRTESTSQLRQEEIRTADLCQQVELEIRLALDSLHSSAEQVTVAEEGLVQAEREVAQAQRRYAAGVATSLEPVDAQTRLERARDNRISALVAYNVARVNLAEAMGAIRQFIQ